MDFPELARAGVVQIPWLHGLMVTYLECSKHLQEFCLASVVRPFPILINPDELATIKWSRGPSNSHLDEPRQAGSFHYHWRYEFGVNHWVPAPCLATSTLCTRTRPGSVLPVLSAHVECPTKPSPTHAPATNLVPPHSYTTNLQLALIHIMLLQLPSEDEGQKTRRRTHKHTGLKE